MKVTLPEFERAGVMVVGDVMLDRYEEVYHHVVGDPLMAMPSTLKKEKVLVGTKA